MKRICSIAVLWLSAFLIIGQRDDSRFVPQGFLTGQSFLDLNKDERLWAVSGAIDGMLAATQFGAPLSQVMKLRDCVIDRNNGQVVAMVEKYIRDRPEQWHVPFALLVSNAMASGCGYSLRQISN